MNNLREIEFQKTGSEKQTIGDIKQINLIGAENGWGKSSVAGIIDHTFFGGERSVNYLDYFSGIVNVGGVDTRFSNTEPLALDECDSSKYHFDLYAFGAETSEACRKQFMTIAQGDVALEPPDKVSKLTRNNDEIKIINSKKTELNEYKDVESAIRRLEEKKGQVDAAIGKMKRLQAESKRLACWERYYEAKQEADEAREKADGYSDHVRRFQDKDWTEAVRLSGAIDEKNKAIESGENELSAIAVSDDVDFDAIDNPKERLDALEVHVNGYKPSGHIDQAKERVMEALGQIPEPLRKYAEGMETIDDPRLSAMEQKTLAERESAVDKKVKGTLLKNLRSAKSGEADLPADGRSVWSYVGLIAVIAGIAAVCLGFVPLGIAMIIAGVVLLIVYPLSKDTKALAAYYERKRRDDVEKLELLIESDENKRELLLKDGSAEGESAMKEFYVLSAVLYNKALEEYRKLLEDRENLKGVILDGFAVFGKKPEEAEFEVCAKALQAGYNNWDKRRQLRHDIDTAASARAELESKLNAIYDKYGVESSEQLDQIKQVHLDYLGDCKTLEDKQKNCRKEYDKCSGDDPGSLDNARLSDEDAEWLGEAEKNEDINKRTSIEIENKIRDLKAHSTSKTLEEIDKQLTLLRDNKGKPKAVGAVKRLLVSRLQEYYSAKAEKLLEPASDLFRRITGDDTAEIALKDGRFLFRLEGVHKPFEALSGGARAQAILAYRLAHIQDGEGENKNPLIFDNALGECDDEKTRALCRAVLDIARSQGRQVFYFTCKKNEFEALKRCFEQNGAGELLQIYDRFGSRAG